MNALATGVLLLAGLAFFVAVMARRARVLRVMRREDRFDHLRERLRRLVAFGFGQKRLVDPEERTPGTMHALIFAAFVVLALRTISLFAIGFSATALEVLGTGQAAFWDAHPLLAIAYRAYLFFKDVLVLAALVAALYFVWLRARVRPDRLTTTWHAYLILGFIAGLMITELLFGASRALAHGALPWSHEPITSTVAAALAPIDRGVVAALGDAAFWTHLVIILVFLNFLPFGKHFHVITALPNVFFARLGPSGRLPVANFDAEELGARSITDLTWKQGLDLYSCTECGRCQTHCPTYVTKKPLTHKGVNQSLVGHLRERYDDLVTKQGDDVIPLMGPVLDPATPWACTTCGWCETACPVFIENIPRLVDLRRYKVQAEADFPHELQRTFEGIERQGNPWALGQDRRADWGADLAIPEWDGATKYDYLFFVGCAGSYDDRQKKVSRALVAILREAGVTFATLAARESCNGDPARRLGNEYLFQTLARTNVELWKSLNVQDVLVQCPHCFNTLANEYPDFGGTFRVKTHVELIDELLTSGRITLDGADSLRATFHDPCYLGRHNGVFDAPRRALGAIRGLELVELPRAKRESFCCGAGGGRMWMEEKLGERINQHRVNEAALTLAHAADPSIPIPDPHDPRRPGDVGRYDGPSGEGVVAVACPFCRTMLHDGVAETGRDEQLRVRDVAELVHDALRTRAPAPAAPTPAAPTTDEELA
ncbi:(Fe-S)-binding protein [Myxococcota bacterium]|nr:(Fe-S)-binding protein [Myxococcota bacterium]